jgi:hypothetical protein
MNLYYQQAARVAVRQRQLARRYGRAWEEERDAWSRFMSNACWARYWARRDWLSTATPNRDTAAEDRRREVRNWLSTAS